MNFTTTKKTTNTITGRSVPIRISLAWNVVSSTNFTIKIWFDGLLEVTATQADFTLGSGGAANTSIGTGATNEMPRGVYMWDIYTDDDSSLTDPGDIYVTAKLPSKLNTNNFDTLGGSGTNRYDRVSERPLSETNYIQHAAVSDVQENFGIQGELEGDTNLCGAQIIARAAWAVAKRGGLGTRELNENRANNKTAGTTLSLPIPTSPWGLAVGHTLLIGFAMDGATGTVSATDNASTPNTYVVDVDKAAASPSTSNVRGCIIRAYVGSITSLTTITITHPSVTARAAFVASFSGIQQASPLDQSTSAVGSSTTPSSGATAATTQANEVIFGVIGYETDADSSSLSTGMTPDAMTIAGTFTSGGGAASNVTCYGGYALQTATSAQTHNATGGANTDWVALIATYKSLGTGVGTPKIMNNGTEGSALTLTETATAYMNIADGGGYPNNPAAVGMRSSNDEPDTFMYECGMLVAYIPGPPTHHHHKWGPTFNPVLSQ